MDQEYFTVAQVAKRLGIKERRIRELINRGELNAHRVGVGDRGDFRISELDIQDWLKRTSTRQGNSEDLIQIGA